MPSARADQLSVRTEQLARALYEAHGPALGAWVRTRVADAGAAEEVVQETVLRAWRGHATFDASKGSERGWMFGIARNVLADRYRHQSRRLQLVTTDPAPDVRIDDVELERVAERSLLLDALATLGPDHRAVVVAAHWDGRSTSQIAEELGIPHGTVKSRLYYALRALRGALEEREVL